MHSWEHIGEEKGTDRYTCIAVRRRYCYGYNKQEEEELRVYSCLPVIVS